MQVVVYFFFYGWRMLRMSKMIRTLLIIALTMITAILTGCQNQGQRALPSEQFQIIKGVTTLAQHGNDIVELTLPKGCVITVEAKKERSKQYASIR